MTASFISEGSTKSVTLLLQHHNLHEDLFFSLIIHQQM